MVYGRAICDLETWCTRCDDNDDDNTPAIRRKACIHLCTRAIVRSSCVYVYKGTCVCEFICAYAMLQQKRSLGHSYGKECESRRVNK